jgi:meso-butanediol dehydrogenase / (S,S)-butanediol dehydrogenase / diacetyl reductase
MLDGKVVFLTGGSQGIGLECAKRYVQSGAKVVIVSNDADSLYSAKKEIGRNVCSMICELADEQDVKKAIENTSHMFGRIDAVHNNAGIAHPSRPLHDTSETEWQALFNINVKSILYTTKHALHALKQSEGCILNTSSLVASIGQVNHAAYVATKGAVNALTRSMALDYAPYKIRVNAIAPAGVWTPMLRQWGSEQENAPAIEHYLNNIHALGYCPEADVVADACVFLLSDMARFITGTILPVSGGAELGYRVVNGNGV